MQMRKCKLKTAQLQTQTCTTAYFKCTGNCNCDAQVQTHKCTTHTLCQCAFVHWSVLFQPTHTCSHVFACPCPCPCSCVWSAVGSSTSQSVWRSLPRPVAQTAAWVSPQATSKRRTSCQPLPTRWWTRELRRFGGRYCVGQRQDKVVSTNKQTQRTRTRMWHAVQ